MQGADGMGGRQLRWDEVGGVAEIEGGGVKRKAADSRPEIERIAVGVTGEAVVDLPVEMDGEGPA